MDTARNADIQKKYNIEIGGFQRMPPFYLKRKEGVDMNLSELITQIPINAYVIIACLVVGYIMKKWLPTDNKIIPTVLVIVGAIISIPVGGFSIEVIIGGAFGGTIAVGLHQAFKQLVEGTKDRDEVLTEEGE